MRAEIQEAFAQCRNLTDVNRTTRSMVHVIDQPKLAGPVSGTGDGSTQVLTVHGRIPSQRAPVPGTYTDTITVTY